MQNKYPLWKYLLLLFVIGLAFLYALPNLYGEDPAIQISPATREAPIDAALEQKVTTALQDLSLDYKSLKRSERDILVRFYNTDTQLKAQEAIKAAVGTDYTAAINLAASTPNWMRKIGAGPMKQGLDLRGGVHFLLEVDLDSVISRRMDGILRNISQDLREQRIRYTRIARVGKTELTLAFRDASLRDSAYIRLKSNFPTLLLNKSIENNRFMITANLLPSEIDAARKYTIEQTMTILRNRVNELGVGEAVVQQQGATRVAVDLPGIQDAARAKQILRGTATLEFHMVDQAHDALAAKQSGVVPIGSKLYEEEGRPLLLKRQVILSGDSITSAVAAFDQQTGTPAVSIQLSGGDSLFTRTTRANIGKLMAIVFVESKPVFTTENGETVRSSRKVERVISVATIQSALPSNFQITGLRDIQESRNLALLLRAGALPAAIYPVEERTVGPTLGKENIQRGIVSLQVGMGLTLLLMMVYYRFFGFIANLALLLNLVFLVAVLSLIDAVLTLPGIAGIVLTIGMAVDANVLIYERIREELRNGVSHQAAIYAGYERAFSTIVDANVTTLIVALVLFAVGTGAVRGFAVTLSIGLLTSMFTAITYTRAAINLYYGGRQVKKLSIGI